MNVIDPGEWEYLKVSGLKMMFLVWYFFLTEAVYPTGMVDLMIMVAAGLTFNTSIIE